MLQPNFMLSLVNLKYEDNEEESELQLPIVNL